FFKKKYYREHLPSLKDLKRSGECPAPAAVSIRQRMEAGSGATMSLMRRARKGKLRFLSSGLPE
ncbi:hypothetical protein ACMYNC_23305, partial [Salmonella enterica subsp. enterica serovar Enteritidis]|uniref:hypothetical protein n=1 Tax=Salmonella enterica TaxID=28901 RepID=UPI0039E9E1AC